MEVLQLLSDLFNPEKYIQSIDSKLSIVEKHRQASLKNIHIVSVGANSLALKLDQCSFPGNKLFIEQHKMHRACDAIVFCIVGGEPYILCCELKSSEPTRHEVTEQFQSAQCFLSYLDSLLKTYHNQTIDDWPRRYFLFHDAAKTPLNKVPIKGTQYNDRPDRAQFLPVQNGDKIYLRKLLDKPL
jgi:hypothetical protein